jgi:hypothetical protein
MMDRQFSILMGAVLILVGALALVFTLLLPLLGLEWEMWVWDVWRLWPLAVVGVGVLFVLPPLLVRGQRGLGLLFVVGLPTLSTGGILLLASLFDRWDVWTWLWPLEILALAAGFFLAALYVRSVWLLVPAIVVGLNGLVFQFCALTGRWDAWAVLWPVEPLSVGLALLVANARVRSPALSLAGLLLCGLAGVGLAGMSLAVSGWGLVNLLGPLLLILVGGGFLIWGLARQRMPGGTAVKTS